MEKHLQVVGKKLEHLCSQTLEYLSFRVKPFWFQLCYFMFVSVIGFVFLIVLKPKPNHVKPSLLDSFFTSVSATTVSSMSTVEMEVFSDTQLWVLTILMLLGGEVFLSMIELQLEKGKLFFIRRKKHVNEPFDVVLHNDQTELGDYQIELGDLAKGITSFSTQNTNRTMNLTVSAYEAIDSVGGNHNKSISSHEDLKYNSVRYLGYVVLGYLLVVLVLGFTLVSIYMSVVPSANEVLKKKGIKLETFSAFIIISTFANCGFVPTNENMVIFRNNSGLLLLLIPQVLFGNTLFPACLKVILWFLGRFSKRHELRYTSKTDHNLGYPSNDMLISARQSLYLVATVIGFILVQFILFCSLEWNSEGLDGMNPYQKIVAALFQTVNSRHSGENIVDLSTLSTAILVIYVVTMYLPPSFTFLPLENDKQSPYKSEKGKMKRGELVIQNLLLSQLSYLVIFITVICIIERKKLKDDPLNFNLLNITIEVISAYGNVGFTAGYSCKRRLKSDSMCEDMMYGFVGKWSNMGKVMLILVMFFGRLRKFNINGGKAWRNSTKICD